LIERKFFKVPTKGVRGDKSNPLEPDIKPGKHWFGVIEYVEDDKFAVLVSFKENGKGMNDSPYSKGNELALDVDELKKHDLEKHHATIKDKDFKVTDSSKPSNIGKKEKKDGSLEVV